MAPKLRPRFQASANNIFTDSDCQLSNDPPGDGETQELSLCNIQQYRCKTREEDLDELLIAYQYEIFLKGDAVDQDLARNYLEETMLHQLASKTGTIECDGIDRGIFSNVLGVNRAPNDTIDSRFDSCVTPPMEGTVCVSMLGGSTVFLSSSNRTVDSDNELRSEILKLIRSEMESDVYVRQGSIEKVAFVNRSVAVDDIIDSDISTPTESGLETGAKAGVASGAALFFLALVLVTLLLAKRNRRQARVLEEPDDEEFTTGNGSLAKKDSLALKPSHMGLAQTPPRKILPKDGRVTTPETPQSDISFDESPNEKGTKVSTSPASVMARVESNRRHESVMTFAVSKSEAAEESSASKSRISSSLSDVQAQQNTVPRSVPIAGSSGPVFPEDNDTVSDFGQGCCMGFSLI